MAWNDPTNPALGLAVLAGVVFAAIVVRQLLANRTDREAESSLALAGSVRDLPASLRELTEVRVGTPVGALIAFAAVCHAATVDGPGRADPRARRSSCWPSSAAPSSCSPDGRAR